MIRLGWFGGIGLVLDWFGLGVVVVCDSCDSSLFGGVGLVVLDLIFGLAVQ